MPISRTDILELVSLQDLLANEAKHIASLVVDRQLLLPQTIQVEYEVFLNQCIDAAKQAYQAIRELNDLYDAGFSGKEAEIIEEMIENLHTLEHDTDETRVKLRRAVFKEEQNLSPVDVIFLYKLIDWTVRIAESAQRIGDRIQICLAR